MAVSETLFYVSRLGRNLVIVMDFNFLGWFMKNEIYILLSLLDNLILDNNIIYLRSNEDRVKHEIFMSLSLVKYAYMLVSEYITNNWIKYT